MAVWPTGDELEHHLMPGLTVQLENVLGDAKLLDYLDLAPELLEELTTNRVHRAFAELDAAAEWAIERAIRVRVESCQQMLSPQQHGDRGRADEGS